MQARAKPLESNTITSWLTQYVAKLLDLEASGVDLDTSFEAYGFDSTAAAGLSADLSDWLGVRLKANLIYEYPTIKALAAHLATRTK